MNYVTTNIRLPEEEYLRLKAEAAKKRTSLASVIREKLGSDEKKLSAHAVRKTLQRLDALARQNTAYFKEIDGTSILREMRYEDA
jgi:histone H3/H4